MAVLQSFGNWLYHRSLDSNLCWRIWIDIYLFACEYLIDELASGTIHQMLSKHERVKWIPNINEIEHIYHNTVEKSPLRQLVVVCFPKNLVSDQQSILKSAPESFVREYAILGLSGLYGQLDTFKWQFGYRSDKSSYSGVIRLENTLKFQLEDSKELAFLHLNIVCGNSSFNYDDSTIYQVLGTQMIPASTFRIFASWLYFDDDLCQEEHDCQKCLDLKCLLDCYEASFVLSQSKVEEISQDDDGHSVENKDLSNKLQLKGIQFRTCLIKAAVAHCQRRDDVPSLDEITRVYSISVPGDPLRGLMGDVYIRKGKSCIADIAHNDFQLQLNASLLERVVELQEYIDKVRNIVDGVENIYLFSTKASKYGLWNQLAQFKGKLQMVANIKVPESQQ